MIKLENIIKTYKMGENEVHALNDITLEIKEKEFVAIIGPSGSRKINLNEYNWMFRRTNKWNVLY